MKTEELTERATLLERELEVLGDDVESLRRAHRADLDSLRLEIEALKLLLARTTDGFEDRFQEVYDLARREISPE